MPRLLPILFALSAMAVTLLPGCPGSLDGELRVQLAGRPFPIGTVADYREPGVYQGHRESHGVWIVSTGRMIVALSAACPNEGFGTHFDPMTQQFKCARCSARFDSNGLPRAPRDAVKSLARCRIEAINKTQAATGDDVALQVNKRFLFRQENNEWSDPYSLYELNGG